MAVNHFAAALGGYIGGFILYFIIARAVSVFTESNDFFLGISKLSFGLVNFLAVMNGVAVASF